MFICEVPSRLTPREISYSVQRRFVGEMCEQGKWREAIRLINDHYGFGINEDFIQGAAAIFEKRLSKVLRWGRNGGPIMWQKDKGTSASHTVQVFLLAGWILSRVQVEQRFKTQLGEMILVHELGESFGELSTAGNRTGGGGNWSSQGN